MKKIILVSLLSVFAVSCTSEDDGVNSANSIVGIWKPVSWKAYSGTNNALIATENVDSCFGNSIFDFKSNNTITTTYFELNANNVCENVGSETMAYAYDPTLKTLTVDGETISVKTLSNNTLEVLDLDLTGEDVNNDGVADQVYLVFNK